MTDNKNMKLNDEALAQASGGELDPFQDTATVTGIIFVDPRPEEEYYHDIWESIQENGMAAYELNDGNIAIAKDYIEPLNPGEAVYVKRIRGYYGYEITGKVDNM